MRARHIVAMFILVAIGLPIASSHATLPKTKSKAIVVNKSIGGTPDKVRTQFSIYAGHVNETSIAR